MFLHWPLLKNLALTNFLSKYPYLILIIILAKCFTTPYFKGCMESLYLYDEKEQIDQMIDFVGKR
ncbi:Ion-transport peptide [Operophtera brumata]|uniref:Ion-transport peptide n=1 Tax=Operophtera brumata TaxID=104452 RepID=A0A0L7KHF4_OPEBR|nr:Ion-transport peptide [Operophtera brumata]